MSHPFAIDGPAVIMLAGVVLFLSHCPIFKPYFGWRRKSWRDLGK